MDHMHHAHTGSGSTLTREALALATALAMLRRRIALEARMRSRAAGKDRVSAADVEAAIERLRTRALHATRQDELLAVLLDVTPLAMSLAETAVRVQPPAPSVWRRLLTRRQRARRTSTLVSRDPASELLDRIPTKKQQWTDALAAARAAAGERITGAGTEGPSDLPPAAPVAWLAPTPQTLSASTGPLAAEQ
jgi:hypothetical protein